MGLAALPSGMTEVGRGGLRTASGEAQEVVECFARSCYKCRSGRATRLCRGCVAYLQRRAHVHSCASLVAACPGR